MHFFQFFYPWLRPISIGHVEAFRIAIEQAHYDEETQEWKNIFPPKNENVLDLALSACKEVRSTIDSLTARTPSNLILAQVINFYGLEERLAGMVYLVPPSSYPWTNELLKESNIAIDAVLHTRVKFSPWSLL